MTVILNMYAELCCPEVTNVEVYLVRAQGSARDKLGINSDHSAFPCGSCTAAIRAIAIASMGLSVSGACCATLIKGFDEQLTWHLTQGLSPLRWLCT